MTFFLPPVSDMPPFARAVRPLAAVFVGLVAVEAGAADLVRGGVLYQNTRTAPLSCGDNGACHGPDPRQDVYQIRRGANDAARIESAIARNRGGMGFLETHVDERDVADIAAWIGAVVEGRVEPPVTVTGPLGTGGTGAAAGGDAGLASDPASIAAPFNLGYGGCATAHGAPADPTLPALAAIAAALLASRRRRPDDLRAASPDGGHARR